MGQKDWLDIMSKQTQIRQVLDTNGYTEKYGLVLCAEEAELLAEERVNVLKSERRIEFGQRILPKIIYAFCDSAYITQDDYWRGHAWISLPKPSVPGIPDTGRHRDGKDLKSSIS